MIYQESRFDSPHPTFQAVVFCGISSCSDLTSQVRKMQDTQGGALKKGEHGWSLGLLLDELNLTRK